MHKNNTYRQLSFFSASSSLRSGLSGSLLAVLTGLFFPVACLSQSSGDPAVIIDTTKGRIVMRVFRSLVPYTSDAFLSMVAEGFYDGLQFHRVESWVVQGGDPNGNGSGLYMDRRTGQPRYLRLEINNKLGHGLAGMVAMARSSNPHSASCQFYILKQPMPQLNGQYAVFGKVVDGMNVVNAIRPGDAILRTQIYQVRARPQSGQPVPPGDGGRNENASPAPPADAGF